MYEEVEINTPLELAKHLINEGDLYGGIDKAHLTADANMVRGSPFKITISKQHSKTIAAEWDVRDVIFYKKLNWHDCIPKGKEVPCYASNKNPSPDSANQKVFVAHHNPKDNNPYLLINGERRKYATPIPADELWVPEP